MCEGNACDVVEVRWDETRSAYAFTNRGCRPVRITLVDKSATVRIHVRGGECGYAYLREFEYPYCVEYCDSY